MHFRIVHETLYKYTTPASESVGELRLCPRDTAWQSVAGRTLSLDPQVPTDRYVDFFGNTVECFSIPYRHSRLRVKMTADVETREVQEPGLIAELSLGETRHLNHQRRIDLYHYRLPTPLVPLGMVRHPSPAEFLHPANTLKQGLLSLNRWIHERFEYVEGATEISTPLAEVLKKRKGVCQDFAHLMLSILRTHGLVARYVSGYIEPTDPTAEKGSELIGAAASHAWVEVNLPDGSWWGLDPTNNQTVGERHVWMAAGRDYNDVAPLRGTYKGAVSQKLQVMVSVRRKTRSGKST